MDKCFHKIYLNLVACALCWFIGNDTCCEVLPLPVELVGQARFVYHCLH